MAYHHHPHINTAAAYGGVPVGHSHRHQIYNQLLTDYHTVSSFPARYAAARGGSQPPYQSALFPFPPISAQETTGFYNYPSNFAATQGGAQPPHDQSMIGLQETAPHLLGGVLVVYVLHVPIAANDDADSMAAPPQRDDGLPAEVVAGFLKTAAYEKATSAAGGGGGGDGKLCAVCLDDLWPENDQNVVALRCWHRFHGDCIGKWLQRKNVCPLCKVIAIN